jgi:uncharacterized protein YndB with AHSA1/START domain
MEPTPQDRSDDGAHRDPWLRELSSEITVNAPVERVWATVTDLDLLPGLLPRTLSARWLDGAVEAAPGARFATDNVSDRGVWSAVSRIVEFVPHHVIAWTIESQTAPPTVCRFELVTEADATLVRQTVLIDTTPPPAPPAPRRSATRSVRH